MEDEDQEIRAEAAGMAARGMATSAGASDASGAVQVGQQLQHSRLPAEHRACQLLVLTVTATGVSKPGSTVCSKDNAQCPYSTSAITIWIESEWFA